MRGMNFVELKFQKQTLGTIQRFLTIYGLLDEHELAQNMIDYPKVGMRVVFIRLYDLSSSSRHNCLSVSRRKWTNTSAFLFFGTLFKKDFSKDIFLLAELVVILDVVVMWLVEDAV
jgi:hypothetical protein